MSTSFRPLEDKHQPSKSSPLACRGRCSAVKRNSLSRIPPSQPRECQSPHGIPSEDCIAQPGFELAISGCNTNMAVCYVVGFRTAVMHYISLNPGDSVSTNILRWIAGTRVNQGMTQVPVHNLCLCQLPGLGTSPHSCPATYGSVLRGSDFYDPLPTRTRYYKTRPEPATRCNTVFLPATRPDTL
ncbi:UNVERIFIED_CONTAM: hypothetical protein FKN15_042296 [Acipenser sinensis]